MDFKPYYETKLGKLYHGDCLEILPLTVEAIDCVTTDPPYGLSFMNKEWDYDVPSIEIWQEVLRVLKPGGHLLSFGGSRTYHRMACRIEEAGFEIRDCIMWLYGSGFPKSMDISKAIDKQKGTEREITKEGHTKASEFSGKFDQSSSNSRERRDNPATSEAKQWEGWGTALKPAHEPIIMARKPLSEKNIAENVLKWGTGGINIDDCRIEFEKGGTQASNPSLRINNGISNSNITDYFLGKIGGINRVNKTIGRFPANLILDEEAGQLLDEQSGISQTKSSYRGLQHSGRHGGLADLDDNIKEGTNTIRGYNDSGGASRFFYCAKASKKERNIGLEDFETKKGHNTHPTVKPISLMSYLIKLITPKNGIVLDPFCGSGSTAVACEDLYRRWICIEKEEKYCELSAKRIDNFLKQGRLF